MDHRGVLGELCPRTPIYVKANRSSESRGGATGDLPRVHPGADHHDESAKRRDKKDRLRGDLDFDVNRRARSEIQGLAQKLNLMGDRLADIQERLRVKTCATQALHGVRTCDSRVRP